MLHYKINYDTFEVGIDNYGKILLVEAFTETVADFKQWCLKEEKLSNNLLSK